MSKKVVVIGAGISGLATASLLAKDGFEVTVLEKNSFLGGRASVFDQDGYVFDKGPSWYMMPEVFDHYFSLFNKKTSDFYNLKRLKTHYKVFFESKKTYSIDENIDKNIELFEKTEAGAGPNLKKYLDESKSIYDKAMADLVMLDYSSLSQLLDPKVFKYLFRMKLFSNLHNEVAKNFSNKDLQKIIEFTTVFLGGSPYNTPAFYSLVSHTDFNLGIYYPMGGMYQIVKALERLCLDHGAKILTDQEVVDVVTDHNRISEIKTRTDAYTPDLVVSSMDYRNFEVEILPQNSQTYPKKYWDTKTLSPSAFIIYLGINKKLNNIEHHNLYFDKSWENHFDDVFTNKDWPTSPSYYVHMPSKSDPDIAPKGCETLMFLVPVAPGLSDTQEVRDKFSAKIIKHFEELTGEEITPFIQVKRIYAHNDFASEYNAYAGTAFGLAHTLLQTAIFRPKNKSKKLKNLYYVGQYTNPGVGVPTCLLSAQITSNLINKEYGR